MQKIKYITNKELLAEIKLCKATYCSFVSPDYVSYDTIVTCLDMITEQLLQDTIAQKAVRMSSKLAVIDPASIDRESIVFRVMTDEHLPITEDKNKRRKLENGETVKTNFNPFRHYILKDGVLIEVGRSHWQGDFKSGSYCVNHGRMSNKLASMFMLLVEQYSRRGNWRGYTYNDEMRSHALTQLSQVGLQFDESRSDNPFAFFTQIIKNCLSFDTLILTREYGAIEIGKVAEQDVTLLDGNGDWVKSHIYDYGIQETVNVNFFGGFEKVSIRSTMQHGWIQKDTKEVIETGHFVERNGYATKDVVLDDLRPSKIIKNDAEYRRGVIHGVIYGDGSFYMSSNYKIRLCSEKICLAPWFEGYPVTYPPSSNGEPSYVVNDMDCDLKAFPLNPGESLDYLLGFLRGWFATDGCASNEKPRICHGKLTEPTSQATICCDEAEYNWLKTWGPLVGWQVRNFTTLAEETNYGTRKKISLNVHLKKDSMDVEDFLRPKHRERWMTVTQKPKGWRVYPGARQDFTDRRMERVYCPEVTTTHSFALANYNHSLNCFRRILNLEHRAQSIRDDLLIMSGAMPSYTRQVDNSIDQREENIAEAKAPAKRGRKPKTDIE